MHPLPRGARLFVAFVVMAAVPLPVAAVIAGRDRIDPMTFASLALLLVLTDSLGLRGSRDSATIALGSVTSMAALPLLGPWGAVLLGATSLLVFDREPIVKRIFNTAQTTIAFAASGLTFWLLGGTEIQENSFPCLIGPFVAALAVHCIVNGLLVAAVVHLHQRVAHAGRPPGNDGELGRRLCRVRRLRPSAGGALGPGRGGRRPGCRRPRAAAALRRPLGVRPVRRAAARVRPHGAGADGRGRDQGPLHPRPQRTRLGRVGADRPGDRDARGPRRLAALRRHAARRRQARRADPGAAEDRTAHGGGVRGHPAAPRRGASRSSARSSSSTRRSPGSCTTTSGSTVGATRWGWPGRRSRSSPG